MKIFWAWQSDTDGKTGRHLVRAALLEAIAHLRQPEEIEEPTRADSREAMHLDHDRQGLTGSPGLVDAIRSKIEAAAVFVGDITPVSRIPRRRDVEDSREKRNMNPNVAIELGYALHARGEERVLLVLNEHYGGREFIPFDLQHLGGPLIYRLAPDASKEEIKAEQAKLRGLFINALRGYLEALGSTAVSAFQPTPSTTSRAVWVQPGAALAQFDDTTTYGLEDDKGVYLRIMPRANPSEPFRTGQLFEFARQVPMGQLYRQQTGLVHYNENGAILMEPVSGSGGRLRAATQVFHNGEVWCIGRDLLVDNQYGRFIPVKPLRTALREALSRNLNFMEKQLGSSPPYTIEFGAVGMKEHLLAIDTTIDNPYRIRDDAFGETFVLNDSSAASLDAAVVRMINAFYRLTGYTAPAEAFT
jgi:hypothetical protein